MAFATPEEKAELAFHVTDSVFTPVFERTELAEAHSQWVETDNQQPHRGHGRLTTRTYSGTSRGSTWTTTRR